MFFRAPIICALFIGLLLPAGLAAARNKVAGKLVKALGASSAKVRIKAATRLGQAGIAEAIPRLRRMTDSTKQPASVRAACLMALARLKDQDSRGRMGYLLGHSNQLLAMTAEKGMLLLDAALGAEPVYLMAFSPTTASGDVSPKLRKMVDGALLDRIRRTDGVVEGAGEDGVLSDQALTDHLEKRRLTGLRVKPEILSLEEHKESGKTTILAQIKLTSYSMPGKELMYTGLGGADAWIEDERITSTERRDLQREVLGNAADSAILQFLQALAEEAR